MALGPTLGGLLIRFTGHVLSVFYAAGLIHFVYACMVWFVVPESLSLQRMKRLRRKYMAEADGRRVHGVVKRLFAFLSPLSLLMPEMGDQKQGNDNSLTRKGRDWNLVLVAASYGCTVMHIVGVLFIAALNRCDDPMLLCLGNLFVYLAVYGFDVRVDLRKGECFSLCACVFVTSLVDWIFP